MNSMAVLRMRMRFMALTWRASPAGMQAQQLDVDVDDVDGDGASRDEGCKQCRPFEHSVVTRGASTAQHRDDVAEGVIV